MNTQNNIIALPRCHIPKAPHPIWHEPSAHDIRIGDAVSFNDHNSGQRHGFVISIARRAHLGKPDHYFVESNGVRKVMFRKSLTLRENTNHVPA